ncbi:MAG: hypothetical protein ACT4NY_22845 [Pseudonocardiales bacterium]
MTSAIRSTDLSWRRLLNCAYRLSRLIERSLADALAAVARPDLRVDEIHKGHRWGVLGCEVCGDDLSLWSTPSVPEHVAKRVHRFADRHRHEEDR